jgi:hypothetical protein
MVPVGGPYPMNIKSVSQAILFPDGWIAVVHGHPYQVMWRSPDGNVLLSKPLPFETHPMADRDKQAVLDWNERHFSTPETNDLKNTIGWPDSTQPFSTISPVLPGPGGNVWVPRLPTATDGRTVYDVIDRQGRLASKVYLGPNERILGFGKKWVYVITVTEDDLPFLDRRPWPVG